MALNLRLVSARAARIDALEGRAYLASIVFSPAKSIAVSGTPQGVVVADFNADGKSDVAFVDFGAGQVGVLLGDGAGGFGSVARYTATSNLSGIAAGDLTGDGKPDLVATGDSVATLINQGNGTFSATGFLSAGNTPQNTSIADLNGDGKLDLVTANILDTFATISLGAGNGTFPTQKQATTAGPADTAIGDVNGDGKADLAIALFGDANTGAGAGVAILTGKGDGTFNAAKTYSAGKHPSSIRLGDFNGDHKLDVVVANGGLANIGGDNNFSLLINKGDGTHKSAVNIASGKSPNALAVGDFNKDGFLDVAAPSSIAGTTHELYIHAGKGNGTFSGALVARIDGGSAGIAAGDFNGDGQLDLINSNSDTGTLNLLLNNSQPATLKAGVLSILGTAAGDKISVASKSGKITVTRNGNAASFTASSVTRMTVDSGDGNDLVDFAGTSIKAFVSTGSGDDTVKAGSGDDALLGGAGKDSLDGGAGNDRVNGSGSADKLFGGDGTDRLYGGDGDDQLDGGGGTDRIYGEAGNDILIGGSSNDRLYGAAGNDTLTGGKGADLLDGGDGTDKANKDSSDTLVSI